MCENINYFCSADFKFNSPLLRCTIRYDWEIGDDFEIKMERRRQDLLNFEDLGTDAELVQEWITLVSMLEASKSLEDADFENSKLDEDALYQKYLNEELASAAQAQMSSKDVTLAAPPLGKDTPASDPNADTVTGTLSEVSQAGRRAVGLQVDDKPGRRLLSYSMAEWRAAGAPIRYVQIHADASGRLGLGLQSTALGGVRVTDISPNSSAALTKPRIRINDMILQINGKNVLGVALTEVKNILKANTNGQHNICIVSRSKLEEALHRLREYYRCFMLDRWPFLEVM